MINKYVAMTAFIMVITAHSFAIAQAGSSEAINPDEVIGLSLSSPQEDRRLSNSELRERIYRLENNLLDNQVYVKNLEAQYQVNIAEVQQLTRSFQGLSAGIAELERTMTIERNDRVEGQESLLRGAEELLERLSAESDIRTAQDSRLGAEIQALSEAVDEGSEAIYERFRDSDQVVNGLIQSSGLTNANLTVVEGRVAGSEVSLIEQAEASSSNFVDLNNEISTRTLYGGGVSIVFAFIILLLGIRIVANRKALAVELANSSESFQAKHIDLDLKLTQLLENQLDSESSSSENQASGGQPEHAFPLQVSAEIHRMRKRLGNMPDGTKGVRPLAKALERLEEGLQEKGYEIVELLGMKYSEGMTMQANLTIDDELEPGQQIITKVNKPQVNYKTTVIQVADVEVSFGE